MNTEELMKLADAYAFAAQGYSQKGLNEARAALEAALTVKQGEKVGINGLTEAETAATASVIGLVATEAKQESCGYDETTGNCTRNPCCHTAHEAKYEPDYRAMYLKVRDELAAEQQKPAPVNQQLLEALKDIAHGLEKARIWGGMDWKYNPLHSFIYLPLRDKARAAIAEVEGKV